MASSSPAKGGIADGVEPSLDARNSETATAVIERAHSTLLRSVGAAAASNIAGVFAVRAAAARDADAAAHAAATGPSKRAAAAMAAARAPLPSRLMDMVPERHRSHPFFLLEPSFPRAPASLAQVSQLSHEIFPRVYLGSVAAAEPEHIAALKITHVVNALGAHSEQCRPRVKYWSAPLMDMASFPIGRFLKPAAEWIAAALAADPNNRVLVHCLAGVSRSATLLLAYAMATHQLRITEAYIRMQTARPQAEPNAGFRSVLVELDEHLFEGAPWPYEGEGEELPRTVVVDAIMIEGAGSASAAAASATSNSSDAAGAAGGAVGAAGGASAAPADDSGTGSGAAAIPAAPPASGGAGSSADAAPSTGAVEANTPSASNDVTAVASALHKSL